MEAITYDFEDPFISLSLSSPPFALVTNIGADDPHGPTEVKQKQRVLTHQE